MTGIDPDRNSVEIARKHANHDSEIRDKLSYEVANIVDFAEQTTGKFDLVVASEVVEHVPELKLFIEKHCALVKVAKKLCCPAHLTP